MNIRLSFPIGNLHDLNAAFRFILPHLCFQAKAVRSLLLGEGDYESFDSETLTQAFNNYIDNQNASFVIADDYYDVLDEKNSVLFCRNVSYNIDYFIFSIEHVEQGWLELLMKSANENGLFLGELYNMEEAMWQSERLPSNFILLNRRFDMYKRKWDPLFSPIEGSEIIDIDYNPGHMKMTYNTWLMAAPEMWFGKNSWQYFKKEEVTTFREVDSFTGEATVIETWADDLVYVKLFDPNFWDYEKPHILDIQKSFRRHCRMDEIELILDKKVQYS